MTKLSSSDLLEKFLESHGNRLEGPRGVGTLEAFIVALGYASTEDFFSDNPGAIMELMKWVVEHNFPDFEGKMKSTLGLDKPEREFSDEEIEELIDAIYNDHFSDDIPNDITVTRHGDYTWIEFERGSSPDTAVLHCGQLATWMRCATTGVEMVNSCCISVGNAELRKMFIKE